LSEDKPALETTLQPHAVALGGPPAAARERAPETGVAVSEIASIAERATLRMKREAGGAGAVVG
jgi:hypothetical protein